MSEPGCRRRQDQSRSFFQCGKGVLFSVRLSAAGGQRTRKRKCLATCTHSQGQGAEPVSRDSESRGKGRGRAGTELCSPTL